MSFSLKLRSGSWNIQVNVWSRKSIFYYANVLKRKELMKSHAQKQQTSDLCIGIFSAASRNLFINQNENLFDSFPQLRKSIVLNFKALSLFLDLRNRKLLTHFKESNLTFLKFSFQGKPFYQNDDPTEESVGFIDGSNLQIGSPARSSPHSQGSDNGERFSRKVFVGGLPPDIDEGEHQSNRSMTEY